MGPIRKAATARHAATASPFISTFVLEVILTPLHLLPKKIDAFPQQWPFPRGDLYHWIPVLNRFDHILELFNQEYSLVDGPQQEPFACRLLQKGDAEEDEPYPKYSVDEKELKAAGYGVEGDRELIEEIIHFTRILLEHCGNRSLYNSSSHLDALLNTTSLSLLRRVLRLGVRLAQRYQVARYKNTHPHAQQMLLQNHYNFKLDRLQKLAQPFPKALQGGAGTVVTVGKAKEKVNAAATYNPSDLVTIAKEPRATVAKGDVIGVHLSYYDQPPLSRPTSASQPNEASPVTPTPIRRTSTLGPSRDRPPIGERSATAGDVSSTPTKSREKDASSSSAPKSFQIPANAVAETPAWALVKDAVSKVPQDSWYDALTRIRIAKGFTTPDESAQHLVEVRLLAIANLAYALGESKFQERIGTPDNEEPKRFHLAQQLCDLLQPPANGQIALSLDVETSVLLTLEALSKSRHKSPEVSDALQISHNHGVIYYELRKVIATLNVEQHADFKLELQETEWREATFDLVNTLLQSNTQARHGERMVNAGIMGVLVEALELRTKRAEQYHEKILQFFDSFIHGIATAFQTLAGVKGLDILADLMSYEVTTSLQNAKDGHGLPKDFKSKVVDYDIPFYQQSTLRQLLKFMVHMFEHNAGTHDRLLRNLIDTPQVLGALRSVIDNAHVFGSNVWSGAVNIVSSFIHNEPTSFQVVGEAGLVKSLLQTIVPWEIKDTAEDDSTGEVVAAALEYKDGELQYPTPTGILPVGETMCDIPTAFGAICLNESGMKLFTSSKALLKFMDIFVSPPHVKALEEDGQTAATIGQAFDELSRHHPQLKQHIIAVVIAMVKRVSEVCRYLAERKGNGSKLWERSAEGFVVSGGSAALGGLVHRGEDEQPPNVPVTAESLGEDDKDRVLGVPFVSACFKFLDGFFHNTGMCSLFCEEGGVFPLLDLATSASNPYDLVAFPVFSKIAAVVKMMCEAKPHLVLPSLIRHTQKAIANLKPLVDSKDPKGALSAFTDLDQPSTISLPGNADGTTLVKSLAMLHMLTHILGRALAPPPYTGRHSASTNQLFTILNLTDIYIELVDSLGLLHSACVWENLASQKSLPESWKHKTEPRPFMMRRIDGSGVVEIAPELRSDNSPNGEVSNESGNQTTIPQEETFAVKNAKAIRYLLSQTSMGIEAFFHSLAQALVPKRSSDSGTRQHASLVADHMAKALVRAFEYKKFDHVEQWMERKAQLSAVQLSTRCLLKTSPSIDSQGSKEALTLVLSKFYHSNGFAKLNDAMQQCVQDLTKENDEHELWNHNTGDALSSILIFYSQVARSKTINDAPQSSHISVKHHEQADYFMPGQFVVEIRDAILPALTDLWHSDKLDKMKDKQTKDLIETLRTILKGEGEDRAITRNAHATRRIQTAQPEFKLKNTDGVRPLVLRGYDESLAREALYRCNYLEGSAEEYCKLRKTCTEAPSFPIPTNEAPKPAEAPSQSAEPLPSSSEDRNLHSSQSIDMPDADLEPGETSRGDAEAQSISDLIENDLMSDDDDFNRSNLPSDLTGDDLMEMAGAGRSSSLLSFQNGSAVPPLATSPIKDTRRPFVTVEDLDEKRSKLRSDLLDRCLEVLGAQPANTFELAELIQAVPNGSDSSGRDAEIGSTLVSSLLSLQAEEPSAEADAKLAAYAHLVALILQDRDFFSSMLEELKENLDTLISWIRLRPQDQTAENVPYIEMVLLIIERVLAEDEQPVEVSWQAPPPDDPLKALPEPHIPEPIVPTELRSTLFDAVVELLPKIGKNALLALSVCRVLAILTRRRELAIRLSHRMSMSSLFLMIRQLGGSVNENLQSSFLIILRNMVEDEAIIRKIMETEIRAIFENHRTSRAMDLSTYTRTLYHLILRDSNLFASVTKELVEIPKFEGHSNRGQILALKKDKPVTPKDQHAEASEGAQQDAAAGAESHPAAQQSGETKSAPGEGSDSVVQYLLRELSNWRDVPDKPASSAAATDVPATNGTSSADVDMADAAGSGERSAAEANNNEKPAPFNPEDHGVYIYRCFLLQCLAELLSSYTRTKKEFINFSRKPEAQSSTPSKRRSGTLNYLLTTLIPVGTLEHRDDIAHRKNLATSSWATTVLVALCSKTPETRNNIHFELPNANDVDSDLTQVRKFVLDHALRAFKDATTSIEPLDQRYSRILALGELFNRMLGNKSSGNFHLSVDFVSAREVGRLMYEKNFVPALTSAIAELDLNFPNAKRAVKYILGPLRLLTELAVSLSQSSDFSTNAGGSTEEEEELSSATSVSDDGEEEREQTPDLYRNSTLGLFESGGGHDHDSESDSQEDEDDMYDEVYDEDDGMDYEDGPIPDRDEVVSDEDEEIDGMGEVEGLPGDVEVEMDFVMDEDDEEVDTISQDESSNTDDDEDDDDEDDDEDHGDDLEHDFDDHLDEITGDDENASMADHDEAHGWDEDDGALFDGDMDDADGAARGGPLAQIREVIGADEGSDPDGVIHVDMGHGEEEYFDDEMPPEDEDDEDDEIDFENDVVEFEEDDDDDDDGRADWDGTRWDIGVPPPPQILRGHHHHHHRHGIPDMFGMVGGDTFRGAGFYNPRSGPPAREEDGTNPLLQRNGGAGTNQRDRDIFAGLSINGRFARRAILPRQADSFIQDLVATMGPPHGGGAINLNITDAHREITGQFASMLAMTGRHGGHALIDIDTNRPWRDQLGLPLWPSHIGPPRGGDMRSIPSSDEAQAVEFRPMTTVARWQEEARMLFGSKHVDKAARILNNLLRLLVPPAMEAKLQLERAEAERKAAAEKAKEEERKKAEAEKAEREAREKQEREEREAREAEEARVREEADREASDQPAVEGSMDGIEQSQQADATTQEPVAEETPAPRVTITIRGRELDITSLGIDPTYLEELPEDMREEVIMGQFAQQRTDAARTGEQPSEISPEFLEALPPELQRELLRQEAAERRRDEESRRRAAQEGTAQPAQPEEMNNADFMAMLDPGLRQSILRDADENTLAALPEEVQLEARNLFGERRAQRAPPQLGRIGRYADPEALLPGHRTRGEAGDRDGSRPRRPVVQMLDKAGIATLLRLMFVSLHHKAKSNLHGIFSDVCKNPQNRAEVISNLLSILQDGTADVAAVERSFAHLSLRAKQQLSSSKTPTPLKRTATGTIVTPGAELSPLNIVQQCLGTLNALTMDNERVAYFFVTEHETVANPKAKAVKKSKGRESKAAKFPLNSLLTLLDRKLITENTGVMEALASLLSKVTQPLIQLLRKAAREADDAAKVDAEATAASDVQMEGATGTSATAAEPAGEPSTAAATTTAEQEQPEANGTEEAKGSDKKKHREMVPPDVPEENIRLVVNIITARECPSKTFTETLDVIKNLSAIPGAREVFGKELVNQAQELSQTVVVDLEDLAKQINAAQTGTDLQGMALANFSSAASMQHKLLRVLVALDYLFDPKQSQSATSTGSAPAAPPQLKGDILAGLYESSTFDKLWGNLSQCLTAIRKRGNMVNVAAILLPMIESLMVVCRNSTLKDAVPDVAGSQLSSSTPPPEARLDSLFFKFTEEHRKILNELIRSTPKLMNGNLAVLAKNSKVLEFDNKRSYFTRKLHTRAPNDGRISHPSLQLNVRRDQVFLDSFKSLYYKAGNEIKYGKLNIRFHNEEGIDAGGVSREWFAAMARQMFNPDYALFIPVASDKTTFHPNQTSEINHEHLMFFKFIGRIIGKALYENRVLDCHFSRAVYRRILGKSVSLKDMESLDLDYYKSLVWILENDITDITFETFSVDVDKFGLVETVDLVPEGRNIAVTEENKQEYVRLVVEHRLIKSVEKQLEHFLAGFHEIVPPELISIFNEQELELLISGLPEIDVDDWRNNTEYHNYQATSPQIQWFWRAVRSFDKEEKAKLLQFVTGTSKVPLNGFKELEGMNGFSKFNIHRDYSSKEKLPSSHTCFNQLDLPEYESYEHLRQQLYTAITAGSEYFGFA